MRFSELLDTYIDGSFKTDGEASRAVKQFLSYIPQRVLLLEFDGMRSDKQGVKDGDKVYKLGLDLASGVAYIEYYDNYNQGKPTLAVYADRVKRQLVFACAQVERSMTIRYGVYNGVVKKAVS